MLNLYFIHAKDQWDAESNFDWHVVASSAGEASRMWSEMMADGMPDSTPDRVTVVINGVSGPARLLDWYAAPQRLVKSASPIIRIGWPAAMSCSAFRCLLLFSLPLSFSMS